MKYNRNLYKVGKLKRIMVLDKFKGMFKKSGGDSEYLEIDLFLEFVFYLNRYNLRETCFFFLNQN
jgi:hypothetical protein